MLKYVILLLTIFIAFGSGAQTAQEGFGIGIILGEPTGISFKNWLSHGRLKGMMPSICMPIIFSTTISWQRLRAGSYFFITD